MFGIKNKKGTDKEAPAESSKVDINRDGVPDIEQKIRIKSLVRQSNDANLKEIDAQLEKESLLMRWQGFLYDPDKQAYVPGVEKTMSRQGAMAISNLLDVYLNPISMSSAFDNEHLAKEMEDIAYVITDMIGMHYKDWEIDCRHLDVITTQITTLVYNALSKSVNDGTRDHWTKRMKLTQSNSMNERPVL